MKPVPSFSGGDTRAQDIDRYPRYTRALAAASEVELRAGDVLFVPSHWWHTVETPGFTIAANYWWGHTERESRLARSVLLAGLLHLGPLPEDQRRFWKLTMDYYVFQTEGPPHKPMGSAGLDVTRAPTPERIEMIRTALASASRDAAAEPVDPGSVAPSDTLQMAPAVAIELAPGDALQLAVAGKPAARISRTDLDVLLQFRSPARPAGRRGRARPRQLRRSHGPGDDAGAAVLPGRLPHAGDIDEVVKRRRRARHGAPARHNPPVVTGTSGKALEAQHRRIRSSINGESASYSCEPRLRSSSHAIASR